jgi:HTH-type transcriptional regulator / antitoxin HipB
LLLIQELGKAVRQTRMQRGLTQAQLAAAAGLSRNTLNRLENGLFPDLGINKAAAILEKLGMEMTFKPAALKSKKPDFVGMASASASVSFKKALAPEELVHALLSGRPTPGKEAHFIVLLEEAPASLLKGLVQQVGALVKEGKVAKNLEKISDEVGLSRRSAWRKKIG